MKLPSEEPFLKLINEILRINGRVRRVFAGVETMTGLSAMQLSVLASVGESRRLQTVSDLGRSLGHPRQVIQRTANDLVTAGLLGFADNPRHKRSPILRMTAAGEDVKRVADERAKTVAEAIGTRLDNAECEQAAALLKHVRGAMDDFILTADTASST